MTLDKIECPVVFLDPDTAADIEVGNLKLYLRSNFGS